MVLLFLGFVGLERGLSGVFRWLCSALMPQRVYDDDDLDEPEATATPTSTALITTSSVRWLQSLLKARSCF